MIKVVVGGGGVCVRGYACRFGEVRACLCARMCVRVCILLKVYPITTWNVS